MGAGFAGSGPHGSFFELPSWVDVKKPPGATKQSPTSFFEWLTGVVTLKHVFFSPNFIWLSVSIFVYNFFPYDLKNSTEFGTWVWDRLIVNLLVVYSYFGFFHITLYNLNWSQRKFKENLWPNGFNLAHNVLFTSIGVCIYTLFECGVLHCYATGKISYMRDRDIFASTTNAITFFLWTAFIPVWRGFHFYSCHRFIHFRPLYRYIHSLHHRNIDIEPFAGLCMHPMEHVGYFACIAPSLYFASMSPFHLLFNGIHLLISPAASHSGWEDHVQADQFHYVHHALFECNYGSASFPLDHLFGTFRDQLKVRKGSNSVGFVQKDVTGFNFYLCFSLLTIASVFIPFIPDDSLWEPLVPLKEHTIVVSQFVAFAPYLLAINMFVILDSRGFWKPFGFTTNFLCHMMVGFCVAVLPVYHLLELVYESR